jgi:hypothetical protein
MYQTLKAKRQPRRTADRSIDGMGLRLLLPQLKGAALEYRPRWMTVEQFRSLPVKEREQLAKSLTELSHRVASRRLALEECSPGEDGAAMADDEEVGRSAA